MSQGDITPNEFASFVKGGAALDIKAVAPKPREWLTDKTWLNVIQMSKIENLRNFPEMLVKNEQMWKNWYELEAPEAKPFPDAFDQRLTKFQRLLVVRCLREDRTMIASTSFIAETLGPRYIEPIPLNLDSIAVESTCRTPVIFLLSAGSDPSSLIEGLSRKHKKELRSISMGQGQEIAARKMLQESIKSGGWVLLQNCHLGLKFLPEVEDTLVKTEEINADFRLWITTEPHHKFPVSLLQCSIKLTNETDAGVKAGLKRCFNWVNQDLLDSMPRKEWGPMIYTMCFIHTVIQERKKFGPLGWNIPYEINQADLETAVQFLQNLFILTDFKKGGLSWVTLKFMICEVIYGGKISDRYDRRQFNTYGNLWLGPQMFEQSFAFFRDYSIPVGQDVNTFRNAIEKLPLNDTPELFGLHPNADITYRTKQSQSVLSTILDIQPKESAVDSGITREAAVAAIADDLLGKLPFDFQRDAVNEKMKKLGGSSPMNIFLSQEIDAIQAVITLVRTSLSELKLAVAGTISTSTAIREVLDSLYDARVPKSWTKISYYSTSLGNWFSELLQRKEQLTRWLNVGPPTVYWLGGLFNPGGFFTAVKQQTTRARNNMPLDGVVLQTFVTNKEKEQIKEPPQEGVYVYGLYLEGCAWSKSGNKLVEAAPKVLYHPMPVLHITAVLESEKRMDANTYVCPCYKNPLRTDRNFIFNVDLRSEEDSSKWALEGVALCCTDLS